MQTIQKKIQKRKNAKNTKNKYKNIQTTTKIQRIKKNKNT